jgi:lantibiotic transport system ATP-binding protein
MNVVETKELTHLFSGQDVVVDNLNIQIPEGSIYGFLGPNGAGKTTSLRLLLGLLKKQQGSIVVFNTSFTTYRKEILRSIGSLIESPSLYAHLTARENLMVFQKIYQCSKERIEEVLEIVGLSNTGKKKAGKFSLGMKQRLSIGMALLHQPKLLILDEPTNGLDPNGIIEIRELLKKLNKEQKTTILISSHLLSEIERLVTHLGIIHQGKLLFQGTLSDLRDRQSKTFCVHLETNDPTGARKIAHEAGLESVLEGEILVLPAVPKETLAMLNRMLLQQNIDVYQISNIKNDLESIFIDLVNS